MAKQLITIFILLNIFAGYFAEAYQGEVMDCESIASQQLNHASQDSQTSGSQSERHSEQCVANHCHFGHCATIKQSHILKMHLGESILFEFNPNLSPIDFAVDLLRPPIAA